jgi:5-formyltetrahydrofolate cyclo-ligase
MKSVNEKEKKLNLALTKLKNLNLKNPDIKKNIENLKAQKNQLEIEKQELEEKYKGLEDDYNNLTKKLDEFQNLEKVEQKRQMEFSEKIDELNQETDTLLDEIDKWQT